MQRRWGIDPQAAFNEKSGYSTPMGGPQKERLKDAIENGEVLKIA
jgi:hypothetical protein